MTEFTLEEDLLYLSLLPSHNSQSISEMVLLFP